MNRALVSTTSLCLAFFVVACSGNTVTNSMQDGAGGDPVASGGASQAGPAGGSNAGPNAGGNGSTTGPSGGSQATSASGGNSATGPTGTGGNTAATGNTGAGGNTATTGTTGTGGNTAATSSTSVGGNTTTRSSTGVGGNTTATEPEAGGSSTGGSSSSSGTTTGGTTTTVGGTSAGGSATGGAATGGTTSDTSEPTLITSAQNAYWKEATWTEVTSGNADVTVNDGSTSQTWDGFGGTFNEKGWEVLSQLSAADRAQALELLFGTNGARFAYGRIPIGASDYATSRYTLNETANDTSMTNFSIARDRDKLIPYIKAAQAIKSDIHFWASPWTPPTWMKDNGAFDKGNMKDDATILKAHALYLSKFVEEYGKEGIKIEAVHPQNEPGYPQDYPSCLWTGALMAKYIGTHLGPMFEERGITAQIFLGTMSNADSGKDGTIVSTVTGDATAMKYVKGYGLQWGMLNIYSNLNMKQGLPVWQTEHKCGNYPWESGTDQSKAPNNHAYGVESWGLIRDWIKKGVNTYSAWNMVLDTVGRSLDTVRPWAQNALLTVDTSAKKLNITPAFYVFRHLSQFVDPGAKVVGTSGGDALAFKNPDGTIVAVIYNSGSAKKGIVSVGGKKLQFDMPSNGWATVNYK